MTGKKEGQALQWVIDTGQRTRSRGCVKHVHVYASHCVFRLVSLRDSDLSFIQCFGVLRGMVTV